MQRAQAHTRLKTHERHTETTQDPYTQRQKQSYCPARAETLDRCTARARPTWVLLGGAACAARITHAPAHTHKTTRQGNGARQTAYRPGTAHDKRRREHHEATKMPKKMKPNRTYMPAECGGVTTPPLLSNALRLQTAHGKSALVASVAPGRCGRDSVCFMRDRAGSERKGAGSRAQVGQGMAVWDGLGSVPQKLDLQMPI